MLVRIIERRGESRHQRGRRRHRDGFGSLLEPRRQRRPGAILLGDVANRPPLARLEDADDVGVGERRRGLCLPQEAPAELRRDGRLRTGDLERHFAAEGRIERQEHDSESAASELSSDSGTDRFEPAQSHRGTRLPTMQTAAARQSLPCHRCDWARTSAGPAVGCTLGRARAVRRTRDRPLPGRRPGGFRWNPLRGSRDRPSATRRADLRERFAHRPSCLGFDLSRQPLDGARPQSADRVDRTAHRFCRLAEGIMVAVNQLDHLNIIGR